MAVTVTQLRSFLAVVRTGSVTAAAEELVVSQPSVSAAVSALSRELGVELTERVGRNVRPSPAGKVFASYAADVVGLLGQGARAAREAADRAVTELRIGAVTTAGEHIAPQLMQAFHERHPEVTLSVDVGNRERVFERLRTHRSDIAIGGRPPDDGFVAERFLDNPIVVITAADDPLAQARRVRVEELGARPWLLREEGSGTRSMTEEFLAAPRSPPAGAHPRLQRRHQAGRPRGPRDLAAVAAGDASRGRAGTARDRARRRAAAAPPVVRDPPGARPGAAGGRAVPDLPAQRRRRSRRRARPHDATSSSLPSATAARPVTRW